MVYLTYGEYRQMGGSLDNAAFNCNIYRANGIIDSMTHLRVHNMANVPVEVKAYCRDLIDYLHRHSGNGNNVQSESQSSGGVSESKSYVVKGSEEIQNDIDRMACDYLLSVTDDNNTPLLYRGL